VNFSPWWESAQAQLATSRMTWFFFNPQSAGGLKFQ
jgi:hypothetical protein